MAGNERDSIEISSDSSPDAKSPGRSSGISSPVICLKDKNMMKNYEDELEIFILEFDPFNELETLKHENADADDVIMVAEKGKVACRDYPHPRHICAKYPFHKTPHDAHCELCFCYVCDSSAPCSKWLGSHCNAFDSLIWTQERETRKRNF